MTEQQVQVGEGGSGRKGARWQLVLTLVVVAIVALGAGALVHWMQTRNNKPISVNTAPHAPDSVLDARSLLASGKPDEANKQIDSALANKPLSNDERYLLYVEKGRVAIDKGDYQAAADAYAKAWGIKQTFEVARKLGTTWQQLGDNAKAVDYYKKAITLDPKDSPTYDSDNRTLQQMIDSLGSGQ
ncbi:MAG TPA: tetratricopeptide repeat protein [Patescibacteria group bacterium]|nr:tetratricopeptide repeat protein [Patescibacteria group bacterium]